MLRKQRKNIIKTAVLSTILASIFLVGNSIINADSKNNEENIQNFKQVNSSNIGKISVALTTNIGTKFSERNSTPATIYKDVFSVSTIVNPSGDKNNDMISENMLIAEEYKNILKSDFKDILYSTSDKASMLEAIIDQLEFRYSKSVGQINKLKAQKQALESKMSIANNQVEQVKQKINSDYKSRNAEASRENIENYLELKNNYFYARTYIVYINQFINEYTILNNYNKKLLDTLINNKNAIIKESHVVIPDSGTELLKEFELLYTEQEYKNK